MPTDGSDPGDRDPMLDSMRSVWREMRDSDEEPPTSGLAELMAAARKQAETMRPRESWWRRALAMLVRPPVLALATVLVIVGGAIALNRHGVDDATLPARELTPADELAPATPAPAGKQNEAPNDDGASLGAADHAAEPPAGPAAAGAAERQGLSRPHVQRPRAAHSSAPGRFHAGGVVEEPQVLAPPPPPPPPPPKAPVEEGGTGADATGSVRDVKADRAADFEDDARPTTEAAPVTRRQATVSTEQLIRQAQVAAQRKDCSAVRATTARIKKAAPAVFEKRVRKQPAIARCLQ